MALNFFPSNPKLFRIDGMNVTLSIFKVNFRLVHSLITFQLFMHYGLCFSVLLNASKI